MSLCVFEHVDRKCSQFDDVSEGRNRLRNLYRLVRSCQNVHTCFYKNTLSEYYFVNVKDVLYNLGIEHMLNSSGLRPTTI